MLMQNERAAMNYMYRFDAMRCAKLHLFRDDGLCHVPRFPFYSMILLCDRIHVNACAYVLFGYLHGFCYVVFSLAFLTNSSEIFHFFNKGDYIFQMMVRLEITQLETFYSFLSVRLRHSREKFPKRKKQTTSHFPRKNNMFTAHFHGHCVYAAL